MQVRAHVADRAGNRRELIKSLDFDANGTTAPFPPVAGSLPSWRQPTDAAPSDETAEVKRLPWLDPPSDPPSDPRRAPPTDLTTTPRNVEQFGTEPPPGWRTTSSDWRSASSPDRQAPFPSVPSSRGAQSDDDVAALTDRPLDDREPGPLSSSMPDPFQVPVESSAIADPLEPPAARANDAIAPTEPLSTWSQVDRVPPRPDAYAPPIANRYGTADPPPRPDVQMTKSRRFNLDYDVTGSGLAGVARVELWITDDDGNTWEPYGIDRDLQSPFLVDLDREGIYGFRLLIHNQDGVSARPPQPGDEPDLWIGLDWTPPQARWLKAELIAAPSTQTIMLQWQANDDHLTDRPVRLSFAPNADGPWSVIVDELANTGSYAWAPAQAIPSRTYLRLEVTDRAGNVTTVPMDEPIGPGSGGPKGIIRGIRPVSETPIDARGETQRPSPSP